VVEVTLGFKAVIDVPVGEFEIVEEPLVDPVEVGSVGDGERIDMRPTTGLVVVLVVAIGDVVAVAEAGVLSCTSAGTRRLALGLPSPVVRL
jgi:hypothetical protein